MVAPALPHLLLLGAFCAKILQKFCAYWPHWDCWVTSWQQFANFPAPLHKETRVTQSPPPNPQYEGTFEEQAARVDKEATPQTPGSSSSLGEAVMPPPPFMANDFHLFRDLVKRVADTIQILYFLRKLKTLITNSWTLCIP